MADPESLTVNELKSALSEAGVELPPTQQKKAFYWDLYKTNILDRVGQKRKERDGETDEPAPKKPRTEEPQPPVAAPVNPPQPTPVSETPSQTPSNIFQSRRESMGPTPSTRRVTISTGTAATRNTEERRMSTPFPKQRHMPIDTSALRQPESRRRTIANPYAAPSSFVSPSLLSSVSYDRSPRSSMDLSSVSVAQIKKVGPVRSFMINLLMALGWLIFIGAIVMAVKFPKHFYQTPSGLPFCDSEESGTSIALEKRENCQPCPLFGYCAAGRLIECAPGYVMQSGVCLEDEEVAKAALAMVEYMQRTLSARAGEYECGYVPTKYVAETDLEIELRNLELHPDAKFTNCFDKAKSMIASSSQFSIVRMTLTSTAEAEAAEGATSSADVFYSTAPVLPIACRLKRKAVENKNYLLIAGAFFVVMVVGNIISKISKKKTEQINVLFEDTIRILANSSGGAVVEHIRDELKGRYKDIPVVKLWPEVEELVANDSRIVSVSEEGKRIWEWTANTSIARQLDYSSYTEGDSSMMSDYTDVSQ